jgi:hypothetical protein
MVPCSPGGVAAGVKERVETSRRGVVRTSASPPWRISSLLHMLKSASSRYCRRLCPNCGLAKPSVPPSCTPEHLDPHRDSAPASLTFPLLTAGTEWQPAPVALTLAA